MYRPAPLSSSSTSFGDGSCDSELCPDCQPGTWCCLSLDAFCACDWNMGGGSLCLIEILRPSPERLLWELCCSTNGGWSAARLALDWKPKKERDLVFFGSTAGCCGLGAGAVLYGLPYSVKESSTAPRGSPAAGRGCR